MKIITPTTITQHGIGLPHMTLGTGKYLLVSTEMFDLLGLSETRGFIFIEYNGQLYVAGKDLPDAFKVTKYPSKYNYTHASSTLAFWLREKYGYYKIVLIVKEDPKTLDGIKCYPLTVKEGVERRGKNGAYKKMETVNAETKVTG